MTIFLFVPLIGMLLLGGCSSNAVADIFQYKDSFVGDNSAVGNIANQLPGAKQLNGIELKTKEEPYGIILNYDWTGSTHAYKETAIYNTTFFFALVHNVDWITFKSELGEYTVTKESLQQQFGKQLIGFQSENELNEFLEVTLKDENIDNLLN